MAGDKRIKELCNALSQLDDPNSMMRFLDDLCTPTELTAMADRWHVARLLKQGIPYRKINEMSGISTATITRVARCLSSGSDGYNQLLDNLGEAKKR
jgi:TrpR-related protein YerC/YecD